jgi:transcriptional regulator with XRE-family HTH domain
MNERMIKTFGERLREIRKSKNLTQKELAEKTGIEKTFISHYERCDNEPSLRTLNWLCQALEVKASELLGW